MSDKSVIKVSAETAPVGIMGQKYLASGLSVAMRLWEDEPRGETSEASRRDYEIVGYALGVAPSSRRASDRPGLGAVLVRRDGPHHPAPDLVPVSVEHRGRGRPSARPRQRRFQSSPR
jgi:hypothetical protein